MKTSKTINEMILSTLTTKISREPKYKKELEALGLKVVDPEDWSDYNYWAIRMEATNKPEYLLLVVSKDYAGVKGVFATASKVCNWNDSKRHKIDWLNFIKVHGMRIDYQSYVNSLFSNKTHEALSLLQTNKIYENFVEVEARKEEEARKAKIGWINQIRSNNERVKELFPNYSIK